MAPGAAPRVLVVEDAGAVADAAAGVFVEAVRRDGGAQRPSFVALSGGSTPARLYGLLASPAFDQAVAWRSVHLFWGDERCVPPADPASNYGLVARSGLVRRTLGGVHRMKGELPPEEGANDYEAELRRVLAGGAPDRPVAGSAAEPAPDGRATRLETTEPDRMPGLDLVLLGLGEDAHTASLFPGSFVLEERRRWVSATEPRAGHRRLTLTLPVLWAAQHVLFLVTGAAKAEAVVALLGRGSSAPAALVVQGATEATVLLDRAAAALLP
jgi:6-phosphogluconolactonase